jgi:hypothetical protein
MKYLGIIIGNKFKFSEHMLRKWKMHKINSLYPNRPKYPGDSNTERWRLYKGAILPYYMELQPGSKRCSTNTTD